MQNNDRFLFLCSHSLSNFVVFIVSEQLLKYKSAARNLSGGRLDLRLIGIDLILSALNMELSVFFLQGFNPESGAF